MKKPVSIPGVSGLYHDSATAQEERFTRKKHAALVIALSVIVGGLLFLRPPKPINNVILISIDTCRPDYLSCYGYPFKTSVNIDKLAENGIVFENTISPVPFTLPAHCSMLTGNIPPYHGVLANHGYRLAKENVTLTEVLSDNGFTTAAFISSFVLDSEFGLDQGFDIYDDKFEDEQNTIGIAERRGDETTRHVIKWLDEKRGDKNFIFLHYFDPHHSYTPPEPFASRFQNAFIPMHPPSSMSASYAGEIAYVDHCIGRVFDKLKELDMYDSSLIIVTSDHGESLGEHKENSHGYFVYQSTVKVPLILKTPGGPKAKRIKTTVGLIDIVPTICSLLDIGSPTDIQGKDLSPYIDGEKQPYPDRHIFCQSLGPTEYMANSLLGVVNDRYKYIQTTRPELYDLAKDPTETDNIIDKRSDHARIMKDRLREKLDRKFRTDAKNEMDSLSRKRLESLGYVSGVVSEDFSFDQSKEDPKDVIDYHILSTKLGTLMVKNDYVPARQLCLDMVSKRPWFYKPYLGLATIATAEKKYDQAIGYLKKTLELKPDNTDAYKQLAYAYRSLNKFDRVIEQYLKLLEIKPDDVSAYYRMASLFYDQGRFAEADKHFSEELTVSRSYVDMMSSLAQQLLAKQQTVLAYKHYLRILDKEPEDINALNIAAWIEGASNINDVRNPEKALEHSLKACELTNYSNPQILDTLAVAYAASGDFDMAVKLAKKSELLAAKENSETLVKEIRSRLALYKSGKMYFDSGLVQQ